MHGSRVILANMRALSLQWHRPMALGLGDKFVR